MAQKRYFVKNKTRESIEAEEIFLDAEAIRSMEDKGKLEQPIRRLNFLIFYGLIIALFLILFSRAGYLQIVKGAYYQDLAKGNRLRVYSVSAPRGIIYDQLGQPLVYNIPSFDLVVDIVDFLANPPEVQDEILIQIASAMTGEEAEENSLAVLTLKEDLDQKIKEASSKVSQLVLLDNIERNSALVLENFIGDWLGLRLEKNARRQYLAGPYFAHVLGYTGQVSSADLEGHPDYSLNDQIGKDGLEYSYESILRGEPGQEQVEINSLGKTQKVLAAKEPQPGQGLVLSVNHQLQEKVYQALEKSLKELRASGIRTRKAAAIALDPRNGGVLALVSLPSFETNLFAQGISQKALADLESDLDLPFLNRALAGQYPPGSTIKPLIASAALENQIVNPYRQLNCAGSLSVLNKYNPQIVYRFLDWKAHGPTDMIKAIAESCNVYFYTVGGGFGSIEGLGISKIKEYLSYFGLGQATDIDLPQEAVGLIPDEEWKAKNRPNEEWYLGDTYHLSIGQGDILTTPIQMAAAVASIANGGTLYQPQVVDKIVDQNKKILEDEQPKVIRQGFIQSENLAIVRQGMRQAVLTGSAQALSSLSVKVAGKTGTAQFGSQGKTHAWFVGFAHYDEPEIVLVVLVEGGGEGHLAAVPVAKEIFEWYFSQ